MPPEVMVSLTIPSRLATAEMVVEFKAEILAEIRRTAMEQTAARAQPKVLVLPEVLALVLVLEVLLPALVLILLLLLVLLLLLLPEALAVSK
jgi:hypothetical protein